MLSTTISTKNITLEPRRRGDVAVSDRRLSPRLSAQPTLHVSPLGTPRAVSCSAENVSEGGLFVLLSPDAKLQVGERCEVAFAGDPAAGGEMNGPASLSGMTCYATVVRTVSQSTTHGLTIGAGLRFDHPLFL